MKRSRYLLLTVLPLAACTRRPTVYELSRWEHEADTVEVVTVVWVLAAAVLIGLCGWGLSAARRAGTPILGWVFGLTVGAIMTVAILSFIPLWSA